MRRTIEVVVQEPLASGDVKQWPHRPNSALFWRATTPLYPNVLVMFEPTIGRRSLIVSNAVILPEARATAMNFVIPATLPPHPEARAEA